ncbi:MAG TPA: hypothetical protein VNH18_29365, partial [Bryobacteraceae bacterium]|nr:hypothetical protein [Bryobacteraceae bacterium]
IRWYEDDSVELYNLRDDPGEKTDLAATEPTVADDLTAKLKKWLDEMPIEMPLSNPEYDADRETEGLAEEIREQLKSGALPTPGRKQGS